MTHHSQRSPNCRQNLARTRKVADALRPIASKLGKSDPWFSFARPRSMRPASFQPLLHAVDRRGRELADLSPSALNALRARSWIVFEDDGYRVTPEGFAAVEAIEPLGDFQ